MRPQLRSRIASRCSSRHRPLAQVRRLVRLELGAILGLHQRHAEHVDVIALPRALRIEQGGARDIVESLRWALCRTVSLDIGRHSLRALTRRIDKGDAGCRPESASASPDPGRRAGRDPPGRHHWACAWRYSDAASRCPTGCRSGAASISACANGTASVNGGPALEMRSAPLIFTQHFALFARQLQQRLEWRLIESVLRRHACPCDR